MANTITVEICCGSAADVIAACEAGADRAELNASLSAGGLTPSLGELVTAKKHSDIPIICMVRPRAGGFCYGEYEFEAMLADAKLLLENGADGIAFGFLDKNGALDVRRTTIMRGVCGEKQAVFHRAFDVTTTDPVCAAQSLCELGITRLLTSGQKTTALEGSPLIAELVSRFGPRLELLAGGGVREHNAELVVKRTGVSQLHFSCHRAESDISATRNPPLCFNVQAVPAPDAVDKIDSERLSKFIGLIRENISAQFAQK